MQSYLSLSYSETLPRVQKPLHHFQGMVDGDARKPFVARILVPFVVRTAGDLIPQKLAEAFVSPLRGLGFHFPGSRKPAMRRHLDVRYYGVWMYLAIGSLILLGEGIYRVLRHYYNGPRILFEVTAAVSLVLWPLLISYASYMTDAFTPTIVVWTLFMAIRRRWLAYYLLLLMAAFHKETMVTIPLALGYLYYHERPWRKLLPLVALQIAGVLAIRIYLSFVVFSANEGSFVQFHLFDHNLSVDLLRNFLPTATLILTLILGLVLKDFREKPRGCKALASTVLPLLPAAILLGYFDEIRQYAEAYPGLVCLAFPTVVSALKGDLIQVRTERLP